MWLLIRTIIDPADGSLSGEGRVYGISPISQNKLYFELHVVRPGEIRVGVGFKDINDKEILKVPLADKKTWTAEFGSNSGTIVESGDVIVFLFTKSIN